MLCAEFNFSGTCYLPESVVGGGVFGVVCKAIDNSNPYKPIAVAIKKIPMERYSSNPDLVKRVYREIFLLRNAQDSCNVIKIIDAFIQPSCVGGNGIFQKDLYIVMEYMDADLSQVLHGRFRSNALTLEHIRYLIRQLLIGLDYLHSAKPPIIHRDLKPHNLLVNENCDLKIADFGLARVASTKTHNVSNNSIDQNSQMTQYVVARAYRAPELVFGLTSYTTAIDMWSVGCIAAEMVSRKYLLPAQSPTELVSMMLSNFGAPPPSFVNQIPWPNIRKYIAQWQPRLTGNVKVFIQNLIIKCLPNIPGAVENDVVLLVDFLSALLVYEPSQRLNAKNAQKHGFMKSSLIKPEKLTVDSKFEEKIAKMTPHEILEQLHFEVGLIHQAKQLQNLKNGAVITPSAVTLQQQYQFDENDRNQILQPTSVTPSSSIMGHDSMATEELEQIEKNIP